MRGAARNRRGARAGFTLIEVLVALGLFSILVVAIVRLLDTSLTLWGETEQRRELVELGSDVLELLARDLRGLETGARADLVARLEPADLDGDGLAGATFPRLWLVRVRGAAEAARSDPELAVDAGGTLVAGYSEPLEVEWRLVPAAERDGRGATLLRVERRLGDEDTASLLEDPGSPEVERRALALAEEVAGGCLWLELRFAATTSVIDGEWRLGEELSDCRAVWDARGLGRDDPEATSAPRRPDGDPVLPRRVRIELEVEPPEITRLRTRLARPLEPGDTRLVVLDGRRLPAPGAHVRADEEWLQVVSVRGDEARVRRGCRGTSAREHAAGTRLHHGRRLVREVPLPGGAGRWLR